MADLPMIDDIIVKNLVVDDIIVTPFEFLQQFSLYSEPAALMPQIAENFVPSDPGVTI